MISVKIRFYNTLKRRAGTGSITLALPAGADLRAAFLQVAALQGKDLQDALLTPEGEMVSHLVVFHNGKLVHQDRDALSLADGDELRLFPAASGG